MGLQFKTRMKLTLGLMQKLGSAVVCIVCLIISFSFKSGVHFEFAAQV